MRKTLLVICGIACVTGLHAQDVERTQDGAKNFIRTQKRYGRNTFFTPTTSYVSSSILPVTSRTKKVIPSSKPRKT